MAADREDFLKKLLATFRGEAAEHVAALSSGLLELERAHPDQSADILERLFREVHSLKGASRAVSFAAVETVCHSVEGLLAQWKNAPGPVEPEMLDLVHEAVDRISSLLASEGPAAAVESGLASLVRRIDDAGRGRSRAPASRPVSNREDEPVTSPHPRPSAAHVVRVPVSKLDAIMHQTEHLLGPRLRVAQRLIEVSDIRASIAARRRDGTAIKELRAVPSARERGLERRTSDEWIEPLVRHFQQERTFLTSLEREIEDLERRVRADQHDLTVIVDGLLREVKETQMLPFSSIADTFLKLARDLARDQQKRVELVVTGGGIEMDRRILDEMRAPLLHLLRNAIDHGIERPQQRLEAGKRPEGTVRIAVAHRSGGIEIAVADDGRGIDPAVVRAAAARKGIASPEQLALLDDRDVLSLIFHSGLSTSSAVTEISGRGVGMAIVQENVDRLGGSIITESQPGSGTTIRFRLPLSLATLRGVLVRAGGRLFVLPSTGIERVARVPFHEIRRVENRFAVTVSGELLSLVWLTSLLEMESTDARQEGFAQLVILGNRSGRVACGVDEVLAEQEVLAKPLGPQLSRVRNVSGASVLGSGEIVPVLNVSDLMKSAGRAVTTAPQPPGRARSATTRPRILVADDSITARTLLKGILESSGYDVSVAVDGVDAWTSLRAAHFDLLVSDVEMPRMDGFELTARVRADARLAETPVVLVTALESREHREKGIDAGANAYIVKSSFDQSDLVEVIGRLL